MRFALILILILISTAHAATLDISVSCGSQGQLTYSMVGNECHSTGYVDGPSIIVDGGQFGAAGATASYVISGNSVGVFAETYAAASVKGSAAAAVSFTDTVFVPGSGLGYLEGTLDAGTSYYGGVSSTSYEITGSDLVLSDCSNYGYGVCQVPHQGSYLSRNNLIPITLGQSYTISLQTMSGALSDDNTPSNRSSRASFGLSFYGGDGTTPVAISETPEPATFALALLPLAVLGCRKVVQRP